MSELIFAIDPSINNIGWSYIFCHNKNICLMDSGMFKNPKETLLDKMDFIFQSIQDKIKHLIIDAIVVEETLVNINPFTSLKLSKGQCSAICGSFGHNIPVYVYSCKTPRKVLLNNGNADKKQSREFIENLIGKVANEHIADSVLLGYFHHYKKFYDQDTKEIIKSKKKRKSKINSSINEQLSLTPLISLDKPEVKTQKARQFLSKKKKI